jgi:hypothetical protein
MAFLTEANYFIYISNRSKTLANINWNSFSGLPVSFGTTTAHNGRRRIVAPTPPKPGVITLGKHANDTEDPLIWAWLSRFCLDENLDTEGQAGSGDTLVICPKKNCTGGLVVAKQLEFYNIAPTGDATFWAANLANETPGMSANSLQLTYTNTNLMQFK